MWRLLVCNRSLLALRPCFRSIRQFAKLDFAELDGVAFGLQRDGAAAEHFGRAGFEQALGDGIGFVELRFGVFEQRCGRRFCGGSACCRGLRFRP